MSAASLLTGVRGAVRAVGCMASTVSLGAGLDAALPWRGLPPGALHEVSGLAATSAVAAMARRALRRGGALVWCRDLRLAGELGALDDAALGCFGLTHARLEVIEARGEDEVTAAAEATLRSPRAACVVAEFGGFGAVAGRRLRHAAAAGEGFGLILRPGFSPLPNPALTRWGAEPAPGPNGPAWRLALWHAAGGAPGFWRVRWDRQRLAFAPIDDAG